MRVVFMGTPEFSVPALESLLANHEVVGVFTQPDSPKGRGKNLLRSTTFQYFNPVESRLKRMCNY